MARVNPKATDPEPTATFGDFWSGIFGTPTVTKAPTPTPQVTTPSYVPPPSRTVPVAQTGQVSQAQGSPRGSPTPTPTAQKTYCMIVYGQKMQLNSDAINWYIDNGVDVRPCDEPTPTASNGALEQRVTEIERKQNTYPQVIGTASQKSDQDIWNHLDEHVWGHTGNPNAIYPQLQKAIAEHGEFHTKLGKLGEGQLSAQVHRTSIEQKVDEGIAEHGEFHTKLQDLGDALLGAKEHRDSIEAKLEEQRKHTHGSPPPNGCDCDAWDIPCEIGCKFGWLKWVLVAIGIGILLWLLRPIFNLIGVFKGGSP